jgi:serine/threonine protein kinase
VKFGFGLRGMIDSSRDWTCEFMLAAGTILQERYRIVSQLGQGGMGAVYEAVDERLDTIVALKETLFSEEKLRKQFEREARLLARMHHQALPRVSDHFNEADGQFLVMQYIAGEDLAEMLTQRNGPFPQDEVLVWADQLCDALDYLHTQDPQIIHRDIKPQNLKLTARGQIVLLDFGLAKGSTGQMSVATTSVSIFGYTPNYAPLEQVQGLGTDPRSDIYALAATLFHLITNVKPPDALSRASAIVNGLPDPLTPANLVNGQVNGAVAAVLAKGMSQKRDDRFESASVMRNALRAASTGQFSAAETVLIGGAVVNANAGTEVSERATQLVGDRTSPFGSEAQTLVGKDDTNIRQPVSVGEAATIVRGATSASRSRMWLGAVVLVVLIVGVVGAFYLYRTRQQAHQSTAPALESPTQSAGSDQPANGSASPGQIETAKTDDPNVDKKAETRERGATSKQAADKTAPSKSTTVQSGNSSTASHDDQRSSDRNSNSNSGTPPQTPPWDPTRNPQGRPPGTPPKPGDMPSVRTMPNGTRIVTQSDGTRIVTMPGGGTRVIPPGEKLNPRRRRP